MRRRHGAAWLLVLTAVGCEGREIAVFEVPVGEAGMSAQAGSGVGGSIGGGGDAGIGAGHAAGSGGTLAGASGGGAGATQSGDAGTGAGGTSAKPCQTLEDCDPGWRCEKAGCDAPIGVCEPMPVVQCSSKPQPVCGCDDVTYWNECTLRVINVTQVKLQDECRATARTCEVGADCSTPYASCSHLLPPGELCGHGAGTCWVLPLSCDPTPTPGDRKFRQCLGPDMPLGPCVSTCAAIASERTHVSAHRDDPCTF